MANRRPNCRPWSTFVPSHAGAPHQRDTRVAVDQCVPHRLRWAVHMLRGRSACARRIGHDLVSNRAITHRQRSR
jgi:hypothetical protein